jgi:hypothetical protein
MHNGLLIAGCATVFAVMILLMIIISYYIMLLGFYATNPKNIVSSDWIPFNYTKKKHDKDFSSFSLKMVALCILTVNVGILLSIKLLPKIFPELKEM